MEEYFNGLNNWTVVKYVGGIYVIITAVLTYIGSLFNKIIVNRIQRESDSKFEEIKGEINRLNSLELNFTQQFGQLSQKLYEKRIILIESYWNYILEIKRSIPGPVLLCYQIIEDKELNVETLNKSDIGKGLMQLSILENSHLRIINKEKIEEMRPFISERLWMLTFVYVNFIGRCSYLLIKGYKDYNIVNWKYDHGVKQILLTVLSDQEIKYVYDNFRHEFERFLELIEHKMLNEIQRLFSNEKLAEDSINSLDFLKSLMTANNKS